MSDEMTNAESVSTETAVTETNTPSTDSSPVDAGAASQVVDLDTVPKFKWAGREWTPKDLQGQVMMQADYTRKTQALAEERKYYDNLADDLAAVKADPKLADEFRKVYPEKFHGYLGYVTPAQAAAAAKAEVSPEVKELLEFKQQWQQERQNAFLAQIDAMESKFTAKYPLADVDKVLMGAQEWRKANQNAKEIPEKIWEQLYKTSHAGIEKRFKDYTSAQQQKQKQANQEGKDVPTGGGVPAQGPANVRTIKQASNALREHLNNS